MQINSGVRKDQKQTLEPLRMEIFHFSERSSFLKETDYFHVQINSGVRKDQKKTL